ncbi:hypothetical protein MBLNU13_g09807t1 [Cladosporium sp. NU13]
MALGQDEARLRKGFLERPPRADPDDELPDVGTGSLHPPHSSNALWPDDDGVRGKSNTLLYSEIHADWLQGSVLVGLLVVSLPSLNTTFLRLFGRELVRVVVPGY